MRINQSNLAIIKQLLEGVCMAKWYENEELIKISVECDEAFAKNDRNKLNKLINLCWERGHDESLQPLERAKFLYNSFTCLSDWISLSIQEDIEFKKYYSNINGIRKYEAEYEKCFYLFRTSYGLSYPIYKDILKSDDEMDIAYFKGFYYSLIVNYSNLLWQCGRIIRALDILNQISATNFSMALGNLGLKISDYADLDYDTGHKPILYQKAYEKLSKSLDCDNMYPEAKVVFSMKKEELETWFGLDYLQHPYDFPMDIDNLNERNYREWCANQVLSLNTLNDVHPGLGAGYDPLHLPSIVESIQTGIIPRYHGLFNQIKQEYVSARFFAYEGLTIREPHFSDKDVFLVNTLDYPVYGLGIEKVKAAYRSVYAIFDRVAYFLNKYFDLGIPEWEVSYKRIWNPNSKDKNKLSNIVEKNYPLLGLWWIFKDINNKSIADINKRIDPVMSKVSQVRNAMEHRYFKILDNLSNSSSNDRIDNFAYRISFEEFEALTIALMKNAREVIILLVMSIYAAENIREKKRSPKEMIGQMFTTQYDDEWKQIF